MATAYTASPADMDSTGLNQKSSQETFISLVQLEPTPMDAAPDPEKESSPVPDQDAASLEPTPFRPAGTASTLGLSGAHHSSIFYLTRIQRYSTYALSIFTSIHLTNSSLIPILTRSVPASESYLLLAREIYQTPLTEPLLVGLPILVHVASGVALRLLRRSQNLRRYGGATPALPALRRSRAASASPSFPAPRFSVWPPISFISISGYGFATFLLAHVFVNRALPLAVEGDSANIGLAYVSHGFARHAILSWTAYTGLLTLGCGHMVWGWAKWLGLAQSASWKDDLGSVRGTGNPAVDRRIRRRRRRVWLYIHGASLAAMALWAAGGLGVVAMGGLMQGWVRKVYDDMFSRIGL